MNPHPLESTAESREPPAPPSPLNMGVRGALVGTALGWIAVFAIAAWLRPYDDGGQPLRMETHRQMGLPPCTFKVFSGYPCPSCGMTTSFALLIHGDIVNSLKANAVGTLLALVGLAYIPWSLACAITRRSLFIASMEVALIKILVAFLILMLVRWGLVVVWMWWTGV